MKKLVRVSLPKAVHGMNVTGKINNKDGSMNRQGSSMPLTYHIDDIKLNKVLQPTDRDYATVEAEKGETVVTNLAKTGIPEFFTIGGKPHSRGGTPLNLPADSFIFSKDKSMKIKDPDILQQFGKKVKFNNKKGFTFAKLSKPFDLAPYHKILADSTSDKISIDTAELMIQNNVKKLGALSLVQESLKGFPNGIPGIAMPYLIANDIDLAEIHKESQPLPQMRYGGDIPKLQRGGAPRRQRNDPSLLNGNRVTRDGVIIDVYGNVVGRLNKGTVPEKSSKSTPYQKVPSNKELEKQGLAKWDMTAEGYNESDVRKGDWVKQADGKWYKVTGYKKNVTPYTGGDLDERLGDLGESYGRLAQRFKESKKLRDAVVKEYRSVMKKVKPSKTLTEAEIKAAQDLSYDQIIDNFLRGEKQVMALQSKGQLHDKDDLWDKDRSYYQDAISKMEFQPMNSAETAAFQGAYISVINLADKHPEFKKELEDFNTSSDVQVGKKDEPGGGTGRPDISDVDGWFGNTTRGQGLLYAPSKQKIDMKEAAWSELEKKDDNIKHLNDRYRAQGTPYFTQDKINVGSALYNLLTVDRHKPWMSVPGVKLPNATFMSPDQQIQNIMSASDKGTKGAGMFGSPQSFAANFANIHGNAMSQVANAIANVQDKNVQIANQFELQRANIMNQASDRRSQLAKRYHDEVSIMNQNFDNAKTKAREVLVANVNNAITNRGYIQNINTMTDQYNIDPRTGFKYFTNPRDLKPTNNSNSLLKRFNEIKRSDVNIDDKIAYQIALKDLGMSDRSARRLNNVPSEYMYPPEALGY